MQGGFAPWGGQAMDSSDDMKRSAEAEQGGYRQKTFAATLREGDTSSSDIGVKLLEKMVSSLPTSSPNPEAVSFALPEHLVVSQLAMYVSWAVIFEFTNRVPTRNELVLWINRDILGYVAIQKVHLLSNGFLTVVFNSADDVVNVWSKTPLLFQGSYVCTLPWDPLFQPVVSLASACPVWVEFQGLPEWLWDSLHLFAAALGKVLFAPSNPSMGKASNKVCIAWDMAVELPKCFNVQIGDRMLSIKLVFGTFFGACFKCNRHGHFARECLVQKKQTGNFGAMPNAPPVDKGVPVSSFVSTDSSLDMSGVK